MILEPTPSALSEGDHKAIEKVMHGEKVLIGLSGGINSMAVLCWLRESGIVPSELHLFYAHFKEHSPDTFAFVKAGIRYARLHFPNVKVRITRNSIIDFFEQQKTIPHPMVGVCSRELKIKPMNAYAFDNDIHIDLVGYVRHEMKRRGGKQQSIVSSPQIDMFGGLSKQYPIGEFTDEWCFEIVGREIGWWPKIYDLRDENGKPIFRHNNCLPCKNMQIKDMGAVATHYPSFHLEAMKLSERLGSYWGRDAEKFYTTFGKETWESDGQSCEACRF